MAFLRQFLRGGSNRQGRVRASTLLVFATALVIGGGLVIFQPFQQLQWSLSDTLYQRGNAPDNIVIAQIDDQTLATYGGLASWSRTLHADAVEHLKAAGARVIVFDLLFVDPSADDEQLATAFKDAGNVVLPAAGVQALGQSDAEKYTFQTFLQPPEPLKSAAAQIGHVNYPQDTDGVLRRVPVKVDGADGQSYPALAVAALFAQTQRAVPDLTAHDGKVQILSQSVPVDSSGAFRPDFSSRLETFNRISYGDIISGNFPPEAVRGKTVLIGLTATGSSGQIPIPTESQAESVVVLGNVLQSLQDGVFIREANRFQIVLSLLPLAAVMMFAIPRLNVRLTLLLLVLVALVTYLMAIALFNSDQKLIMNLVYPAVVLSSVFLAGLAHRVTMERADRRDLGDLFGKLASPEIVQELVDSADRGELELGGTLREVTVLFADLRGFTGISERLPPDEVVQFLNRAFDAMIESIVRQEGIVNKFGGDMVMAIWNAPRSTPDHALKACRAALDALDEMERRGLWLEQEPSARFGFGINSGDVVAGNVGSAGRLEYTVMGDAVNVASRLCGAAGGGEVWIGERTLELAGDALEVTSLGPQTLKGRSQPVEAYRVLTVDRVAGSGQVVEEAPAT